MILQSLIFNLLFQLGMQQAYDLGTFLKQIYIESGFIEARYNREQVN